MNEFLNVAIIGCGNVGRRHLQGLGLSNYELAVHVYDAAPKALADCKHFVSSLKDEIKNVNLSLYDELIDLGKAVDSYEMAIIASTADRRAEFVATILDKVKSKNWLLEKQLTQSEKELDDLELCLDGSKAWVNHFRRAIPFYQELRKRYFEGQQVDMVVSGPNIRIGGNASHFVDLVNYWSGEFPLNVDASGLTNPWHPDERREGFREVDGTLKVIFSKGSALTVNSHNNQGKFSITGSLKKSGKNFSIDEETAVAIVGANIALEGRIPFQSELTGSYFDQLYRTGTCKLTPFIDAAKCYRPMIEALLSNWQSTEEGKGDLAVPLT